MTVQEKCGRNSRTMLDSIRDPRVGWPDSFPEDDRDDQQTENQHPARAASFQRLDGYVVCGCGDDCHGGAGYGGAAVDFTF